MYILTSRKNILQDLLLQTRSLKYKKKLVKLFRGHEYDIPQFFKKLKNFLFRNIGQLNLTKYYRLKYRVPRDCKISNKKEKIVFLKKTLTLLIVSTNLFCSSIFFNNFHHFSYYFFKFFFCLFYIICILFVNSFHILGTAVEVIY